MNLGELKQLLKSLPSNLDELPINLVKRGEEDAENIWLDKVTIHETGESGYSEMGEITLTGDE